LNSIVILMLEAEQPEGLSSRKLVVETAKHNVLTAYSADNGMNLLHRFPNVDAIFVHEELLRQRHGLLAEIKKLNNRVPIILGSPFGNLRIPDVDFVVDSYRPHDLLTLLTSEFGDPGPDAPHGRGN
jgi:hypothetical protein